jgi:hypothetical protein
MTFSAFSYFTNEEIISSFVHLGYPDYFRIELGISKFLGAVILILPMVPVRLKEFAYFGFALTFISAFIAHMALGDPGSVAIAPLVFLVILIVSYIYFHKLNLNGKAIAS